MFIYKSCFCICMGNLVLSKNIRHFFWQVYDPYREDVEGILLAGYSGGKWYSSCAVKTDFLEDPIRPLILHRIQESLEERIIPFIQVENKNYDKKLIEKLKSIVFEPHNDIIVLKPTNQTKKKYFVVDYVTFGDEIQINQLEVTDKINYNANRKVANLMDYWILMNRLKEDKYLQ